jgi:hypothetical protein
MTGHSSWSIAVMGLAAILRAGANAGTFTASQGHFTLHTISRSWDDAGTYVFQGPDTVVATGKLGTGTWRRMIAGPR